MTKRFKAATERSDTVSGSLTKRRLPKWSAVIFVLVGFPAVHVVAPWLLSRLSLHHGWHGTAPGLWNLLGLAPLAVGGFVAVYCLVAHLTSTPRRFEFRRTPEYLLTSGPYRFTRNPLYLSEALMWLGWAVIYGSAWVLAALITMILFSKIVICSIVRLEERDLEARFGEQYREYMAHVPRWI